MSGFQPKNLQSVLKDKKVAIWRDKVSWTRYSYVRDVVLSGNEFKTSVIIMLGTLIEKVDNMQEQVGDIRKEIQTI